MAFGKWILALTWGPDLEHSSDDWQVFETYKQAETKYNEVIESDDLCIASITLIMKSTDYIGALG